MTEDGDVLWDEETPAARFQEFLDQLGPVACFATVVLHGETRMSTGAVYRRDQAIDLAYRLKKMARQIEADYESAPDL